MKLLYSGKNSFIGVSWEGNYSAGTYYGLTTTGFVSGLSEQTSKEFPRNISMDGNIAFIPFRDRFYFKRTGVNNPAWRIDKNHQREFASNIPTQDQLEDAVEDGILNKGTKLYHREDQDEQSYTIREMD